MKENPATVVVPTNFVFFTLSAIVGGELRKMFVLENVSSMDDDESLELSEFPGEKGKFPHAP